MKYLRHGRLDKNDFMNNVSYNVNTDVVTSNNYYITLQNSCQQQPGAPVQFSVVLFPTYLSEDCMSGQDDHCIMPNLTNSS